MFIATPVKVLRRDALESALAAAVGVMQQRIRRRPRRQIAINNASVTSCALISALHRPADDAARKPDRSPAASVGASSSAVQTYVKSAIHLPVGLVRRELAVEHIRRDC